MKAGLIGLQGDRKTATKLFLDLVNLSETHFGRLHHRTLSAIEDAAFQAQRCGWGAKAIDLRREALARRIELAGTAGSLQTAATRNNLAFSLLEFGGPESYPEVESFCRTH